MLTYDAEFWNAVRTDEKYGFLREELSGLYAERNTPIIPLPYGAFKLYSETGERKTYEKLYTDIRKQFVAAAMMYLIYQKDEYRFRLEDVVWAMCDEYSWCLPAHMRDPGTEGQIKAIDLFSSEIAFSLSELIALTGDRLDKAVRGRVTYEVDRRVIRPFLNGSYGWERSKNNWAAACACQVAGTFLYTAPGLFPKVKNRLDAAMDSFLSGFGDDGACLEGVSYWEYGFGLFVIYQELLSGSDANVLNIFKDGKVKNIARFFQKSCLRGGMAVTFSDCQPKAFYSMGLGHYLKRIYGDEIKLPPVRYAFPVSREARLSSVVRRFLYYNPDDNERDFSSCNYYLADAQWFIKQNDSYSFAAKGGHNGEPHNHNDVGSFLVGVNGRQILCDIGVGVYSKEYFAADTRYTLLGNSSKGHSVPVINRKEQLPGIGYGAKDAKQSGNRFSIDILGAYGEKGSLIRVFETLEKEIVITDTYRLENPPEEITERFVSYEKPRFEKDRVIWDGLRLEYDSGALTAELSETTYENNFIGKTRVYLIDLKAAVPAREMEIRVKLSLK